ncbi:MAG: DUF3575 domain-containing protein [Bacteroidia bacterium]|nr:DUF3575 domain-containing protein [Bacteroidia bacterium]
MKAFFSICLLSISCFVFSQQPDTLRNKNANSRQSESGGYLDEYYRTRGIKELPTSKNRVSWYPFAFFYSGFKLGYERAYSSNKSLNINVSYSLTEESHYYSNTSFWLNQSLKTTIYNFRELYVEIQPRFYVSSEAAKSENTAIPGSFYASPFLASRFATFTAASQELDVVTGIPFTKEDNYQAAAVAAGVIFGYNAIIEKRFSIDLYLGGGVLTSNANGKKYLSHPPIPINSYRIGIMLQPGFSIGILF